MFSEKATPPISDKEKFKAGLEDFILIAEKLTPLCKTPAEMVGMVKLALSNEGQLRLLCKEIFTNNKSE